VRITEIIKGVEPVTYLLTPYSVLETYKEIIKQEKDTPKGCGSCPSPLFLV
jgi:hypothetical protein